MKSVKSIVLAVAIVVMALALAACGGNSAPPASGAFASATGPSTYRHNGADIEPWDLAMLNPTIAADGRVFMHTWVGKFHAGQDNGAAIASVWTRPRALMLARVEAGVGARS